MGNLNSCKIDIIGNVPEEVAFLILRFVQLQDIARCVLVCKRWKALVSQGPLWDKIAKSRGFFFHAIRRSCPAEYGSYRDLFIALQMRQSQIMSAGFTSHRFVTLQGLPSRCNVEWSDAETLVRTECLDEGTRLVVESFDLNGQYSQSRLLVQSSSAPVWSHASPRAVYVATKDGVWRGYDRSDRRLIFQWRGRLLNGEGLTFGCCRSCMLVVAACWVPSTNPGSLSCHFQAVQLYADGSAPDDVVPLRTLWTHHQDHDTTVKHDANFWTRKVIVLPGAEGVAKCSSHRIILQCDSCTILHSLEIRPRQVQFGKELCLDCAFVATNATLVGEGRGGGRGGSQCHHTSTVRMSCDDTFLAAVSNNRLCVWEVGQRPRLVSCVTLAPPVGTCAVHLAGVGNTLALVVYITPRSSVAGYILQVVNVSTGQVVRQFERAKEKYTWNHDRLPDMPHITCFAHRPDERWLSDITCDVPSPVLWALHSYCGLLHVEAVFLDVTAKRAVPCTHL